MITEKQPAMTHKLRVFGLIWFGQLVSIVGSGLTGFALGVWVYESTGSVTQLALISFFFTLPGIVLAPVAGALVDRWDRRWVMILTDSGAALSTLAVWLLLRVGQLEIWHIYIANTFSAVCITFQQLAYSAATTLLVPKKQFGRASGMIQLGPAMAQIITPALAGAFVVTIGIPGIVLIDFATFVFALLILFVVRIPKPKVTAAGREAKGTFLHEATYGWAYIKARPGLLGLTFLSAAMNFAMGIVLVLIVPLVLSFTDASVLGVVQSIAGGGMLLGALAMSVWGGPSRRINGVLSTMLLRGIILFLGGLQPSAFLIATVAFVFMFNMQITIGCIQAIWQSKVAPDVQGRVFAARQMVSWASSPLAYLVAGPLADNVFEPLLAINGPLAGSIGQIVGTGPGRGIGLLFIVIGILVVLITMASYLYPRLRFVEDELPDTIGDDVSGA